MKWSRLTVNIEPAIAAMAKKQAKSQRRSFAAYIATLIEQDLAGKAAAQQVAEPQAPYHSAPAAQKKPVPDKARRPGAA